MGLDVRICAPELLWPSKEVQDIAQRLAKASGAWLTVTDDVAAAVEGVDFIYTDIWVSMGEPTETWTERINELTPYQVNKAAPRAITGKSSDTVHALPSAVLHSPDTEIGKMIYDKFNL